MSGGPKLMQALPRLKPRRPATVDPRILTARMPGFVQLPPFASTRRPIVRDRPTASRAACGRRTRRSQPLTPSDSPLNQAHIRGRGERGSARQSTFSNTAKSYRPLRSLYFKNPSTACFVTPSWAAIHVVPRPAATRHCAAWRRRSRASAASSVSRSKSACARTNSANASLSSTPNHLTR